MNSTAAHLQRRARHLQDRFEIDFDSDSCPVPFSRIEELVLARNAGIHSDNPNSMKTYLKEIKSPRFVNEEGELCVNIKSYQAAVSDTKAFMSWVIHSIRTLRYLS